jgi:hypothetical protein
MFKQHVNTPRYAKDAATKLYVDQTFEKVKAGASSSVFDYRVDGTTTAAGDPGAGKFRYSDASQTGSNYLFMDWITQDGFDVVALFQAMTPLTEFLIQDKDFSINNQKWRMLGPAVMMPDWFQIEVEFIEGDAIFSNNQLVSFVVMFQGQEGEPGPIGPQGPTGPTGPAGPGVAAGGSTGQLLSKINNTDYNTQWTNPPVGDVTKSYTDTQDALRVLKAGDTMTGQLTITRDYPGIILNQNVAPASGSSAIAAKQNNVLRWLMSWTTQDAAQNFNLQAFDDGGTPRVVLDFNRATGLGTLQGDPTVALGIATKQYVDTKVAAGGGGNYVLKTGDTMTGGLTLNYSDPTIVLYKPTDAGVNQMYVQSTGKTKWLWRFADAGTNDLNIYRMNAAGDTILSTPIAVQWSTGNIFFQGVEYHKYTSPGAGGWYDTQTISQRFFVGTEGGTDNFRMYSAALGMNVFNLSAASGQLVLAKGLTVGPYNGIHYRQQTADYSVLHYSDNTSYYLLFTNAGDPTGNYSNLRPFYVNMSNGNVVMGHALTVNGVLAGNNINGTNISASFSLRTYGWAGNPDNSIIFFSSDNSRYINYYGGNYTFAGGTVGASNGRLWGASDFANPSGTYLPLAGGQVTGQLIAGASTGACEDAGQHGLECRGAGGGHSSVMAFHRPGAFAANLALGTDNNLRWGGWSFGAVSWRVVHEGLSSPTLKDTVTITGSADAWGQYYGRLGINGTRSNTFSIYWDGRAWCMIDNSNMGQFSGVSDYRAKKDVENMKSMWDEIKKVRPISFKFNDWMPEWELETQTKRAEEENREVRPFIVGSNMTEWGFIAHELQEALIPTVSSGYKDIQKAVQVPNPLPLIAMTVKALQEAIARIEIIEAKLQ